MGWKRYIEGTKNWDFATSFSVPEVKRVKVSEREFILIGHPKCKQNVQVVRGAKKGTRFCPNCNELF